jgi:AraC-like DNA-binding protein
MSATRERHTSYLGVENAPTLFISTLQKSTLFVNRERCDEPNHGMTPPYELEDAFAVYIHLRDFAKLELWCEGRREPTVPYRAGSMIIYDLERPWRANMQDPFDCLHLHVPRAALDEIADDAGMRRIDTLNCPPDLGVVDPVVNGLGRSLLPALERPQQANKLFVDHVVLALHAHLAQTYGGMPMACRPIRGGLAPWQERTAKALLNAHVDGEVSLTELARKCGLSRSHFARAFKQTTGQTPHRWLLVQRVEQAKGLLLGSNMSLAKIALTCGFADQSHFTRVFNGTLGASPGEWRRTRKV